MARPSSVDISGGDGGQQMTSSWWKQEMKLTVQPCLGRKPGLPGPPRGGCAVWVLEARREQCSCRNALSKQRAQAGNVLDCPSSTCDPGPFWFAHWRICCMFLHGFLWEGGMMRRLRHFHILWPRANYSWLNKWMTKDDQYLVHVHQNLYVTGISCSPELCPTQASECQVPGLCCLCRHSESGSPPSPAIPPFSAQVR